MFEFNGWINIQCTDKEVEQLNKLLSVKISL
ncbi:MAG: hypothetical protein K0R50_916 [Eubacterium sp.]|nr:hypothetical protein [Eubacterium sp.]